MQRGAEDIARVKYTSERGGLYIHIAYCRKKCIYCDFFSAGDRIADWHIYVDALCSEFKERIKEMACPLRTVYIGGGTPSLMPEEEFHRLCEFIMPYLRDVEEFTIEVNPDDVNEHMLGVWNKGGINRLSMGIQTFDDNALLAIGRRHTSKEALQAYYLARNVFRNVSIDLMFGLPGQTLESWTHDVQTAISLRPEHISAYSLMFEEGTALTTLRDIGRVAEAPEDVTEQMFLLLIEELKRAGYDHYEISNFAIPGYSSQHNSSYWLQLPYLGIGPSAHSYDGKKTRKANRANLRGYLDFWTSSNPKKKGSTHFFETEHLSFRELIEEYVMTRMRMKEGIPLDDFRLRFGETAYASLMANCKPLFERGVLVSTGNNIFIREQEILISDSIILDMLVDNFSHI